MQIIHKLFFVGLLLSIQSCFVQAKSVKEEYSPDNHDAAVKESFEKIFAYAAQKASQNPEQDRKKIMKEEVKKGLNARHGFFINISLIKCEGGRPPYLTSFDPAKSYNNAIDELHDIEKYPQLHELNYCVKSNIVQLYCECNLKKEELDNLLKKYNLTVEDLK